MLSKLLNRDARLSPFTGNLLPQGYIPGFIPTEVAVAYGRRSVGKLVDVLRLKGGDEIPHTEHAHCLRVFTKELSTQEYKAQAISYGAPRPLVILCDSESHQVRQLSCKALTSLCQLSTGRKATIQAGGIEMLTSTLWKTPEEATETLAMLTSDLGCATAVMTSEIGVVANLVKLINDEEISYKAKEHAAVTLEHILCFDDGIMDCLKSHVPRAIVYLTGKALSVEDLKGPKGTPLRVACASCLARLCHHTYGKVQVQEQLGIPAMARLCLQNEWEVRKRTTAALMGITIEKDAKVPVVEICGRTLVSMCRKDEVETAENARSALFNACEHPKARSMVSNLMTPEELEFFLGTLKPLPPGV